MLLTFISVLIEYTYFCWAIITLIFTGKTPIWCLLDNYMEKAEAGVLEPRQLTAIYVIIAVTLLIFLCVQAFWNRPGMLDSSGKNRNRPGAYSYSKINRNRPGISDYLGKEMLDDDAPDEFEHELDML